MTNVFAIEVDMDGLTMSEGSSLKNFPIPMPRDELAEMTEWFKARNKNRCEWARRVLTASFKQLREQVEAEQSA